MMIIYIAGLQNVSPDLLEAAQIDGANSGRAFEGKKLPMVMPSITICLFLSVTNLQAVRPEPVCSLRASRTTPRRCWR